MALSQTLGNVLRSTKFRLLVGVLAIAVYGKFLFAVLFAISVLVVYVLYKLVTFRKSPPLSPKPKIRFKFLDRNEWKKELGALIPPQSLSDPIVSSAILVSGRLDTLIDLIIQNFILGWYAKVSNGSAFPDSVRIELKSVLRRLHERLASVNIPELLVFRVVPLLTTHYTQFVSNPNLQGSLYTMEGKLATARSIDAGTLHRGVSLTLPGPETRKREKEYLRSLIEAVIPLILTEEERKSSLVAILVREILSCTILANVFEALSEGDLINQLIVSQIGSTLQRRKQVRRLRKALEQHTKPALLERISDLPLLRLPLSADTVLLWKEAVQNCQGEQRLNALSFAVETAKSELSNVDVDREQEFYELELLSLLIEKKLIQEPGNFDSFIADPAKKHKFREYLRTSKNESLLDCWTEIEEIKAPLEDVKLTHISLTLEFSNTDEIVTIFDRYFSFDSLGISPEIRGSVEKFVHSNLLDPVLYSNARSSLLVLQEVLYNRLKSVYFPQFQKSEGFVDYDPTRASRQLSRKPSAQFFKGAAAGPEQDHSVSLLKISPSVVTAIESAFEKIMENSPNLESKEALFNKPDDVQFAGASAASLFGDSTKNNSLEDFKEPVANRLSRLFEDSGSDSEDTSFDSTDMRESQNLSDSQLINLEILLAAPGDLQLKEQIDTLDKDIETLSEQSEILISLIKKAELTNNVSELRVLKRSNASVEKEISSKELQKQQYIVQENENSLFGKSQVRIQSCMLNSEELHSYALYIIEVQKFSSDNPSEIVAGWVVARRFSQFYKLNEYLKRTCPAVAEIKFPKKTVPYLNFQKIQQIEIRKPQLEAYLKELLDIPAVCSNPLFRSFLSSEHFDVDKKDRNRTDGIFNRFYKEFASKAGTFSVTADGTLPGAPNEEMIKNMKEMERELKQFDEIDKAATGKLPFIKPIFDLILVVFDLGAKNWLRGRALLVILQQVLGSTIEKTITSAINGAVLQEERLVLVIDALTLMLFPGGKFRDSPEPRSRPEQLATRQQSFSIFSIFMSETCSKIFGARHTSVASSNLLEMLQNDYLNKSLLFKLLDVVFDELFPEANIIQR